MKKETKNIIERLEKGEIDLISALTMIGVDDEVSNMGFARLDHGRPARCGFPEFIYGKGKSFEQVAAIITAIVGRGQTALATKIDDSIGTKLTNRFPEGSHDPEGRTFMVKKSGETKGLAMVVTAGTTDVPVAKEALNTIDACGCGNELIADVGVAGLHRLLAVAPRLREADVVVVVAGMEGALPSVVGGMVPAPVIAVPTSVGYGASLNGLSALFSMLNSCASGVTVVNVDNGFGAGCAAARIINSTRRCDNRPRQ